MRLTNCTLWLALILALSSPIKGFGEDLIDGVVRVYSQAVSFKVPAGWKGGSRSDNGSAFRLELIPPGETVQSWTSMLTVTGYRDLAARLSALQAFEIEAASVVQACPNEAVKKLVTRPKDSEYETVHALIGCRRHPTIADKNEIGFYSFIRGKADMYMIKKSFREPLSGAKTPLDEESYSKLAPEVLSVRLLPAAP